MIRSLTSVSGLSGKIHLISVGTEMTEIAAAVATHTIRAEFDGEIHSFSCRSDQTVLNAAEAAGVMLPSSLTFLSPSHGETLGLRRA